MKAKLLLLVVTAVSVVALAGCGGGGGGSSLPAGTLAVSSDGNVVLKGSAAAVPPGVSLVVLDKAAVDVPDKPVGPAFVAAAECSPAGTTFSQSVSLVFHLAAALPASTEVRLYEYTPSGANKWTDTGIVATLSADGLTATVVITKFNSEALPYYMLVSG